MEEPRVEKTVLSEVWISKIPVRVSLKHSSVPDHPLPFYAEVPRFAYLPFIHHDAIQFFARSSVDAVKHNLVFEFEGVTLPWHIPVGILYDLLGDDQVPWSLTISFVSVLPCELLPWDDEEEGQLMPLRRLFKNTLKEAAYILKGSEGSNGVAQMDLESTEALWQSSRDMNLQNYEDLSTVSFADRASTGNVPVRIFLQKGRQVLRWKDDVLHLSRPIESDRTLLEAFQKFFRNITWIERTGNLSPRASIEDITDEDAGVYLERPTVKTCSMMPDLNETTFGWLHRSMHAPDNFLYIVITPKKGALQTSQTETKGN